jgi:hypothetical protein
MYLFLTLSIPVIIFSNFILETKYIVVINTTTIAHLWFLFTILRETPASRSDFTYQ